MMTRGTCRRLGCETLSFLLDERELMLGDGV